MQDSGNKGERPFLGRPAEWIAVGAVLATAVCYIRVYAFYSSFGISVRDFFVIADYIPASIGDVLLAAIAALFSLWSGSITARAPALRRRAFPYWSIFFRTRIPDLGFRR